MKVLVTGAAGFVGANLTQRLQAEGYEVAGIDILHRNDAWRLEEVDFEYHIVHLSDMRPGMINFDAVVHCASVTNPVYAQHSPSEAMHNTLNGTLRLLQCLDRSQPIVHISTHSVYGQAQQPLQEETPLKPTNIYGMIKAAQEHLIYTFQKSYDLQTCILRSSNMYGEMERSDSPVALFLRMARADKTITLHGGGLQTRDFNYVGNMIDAIILSLEAFAHSSGMVYQIGSDQTVSIKQLAEAAVELAGSGSVVEGEERAGEAGNIEFDISRARTELHYEPTVQLLPEGLERTMTWLKNK